MKKKISILCILFAILVITSQVYGVVVVSSKVTTGGSLFDPIKMTSVTATDVDTAGATVFTTQKLTLGSWMLYITNTGANALTDLEILLFATSKDVSKSVDVITIASSVTFLDNTCTTTLATPETCIASSLGGVPYGYINVIAKAADANKTNLLIRLLEISP